MVQGNYERVLEKIASSAGLEKEEVERRVEAKRSKLSGLISKEGAAQAPQCRVQPGRRPDRHRGSRPAIR